jgi:superfamily I DNA/RNA helicase
MEFKLTDEQINTIDLIKTNQSVAVQAFAGSAKSTTAKEACKSLSDPIYLCFNKHNVEDAKRMGLKAECKTTHSLGYAGIKPRISSLVINTDKSAKIFKKLKLSGKLMPFQAFWDTFRLHNLPLTESGAMQVTDHIEGDLQSSWVQRIQDIAALNTELYHESGTIDYVDMLWLPNLVREKGWLKCSNIIIDEFQDTSELAIAMIKHAVGANTPIIGLGDRKQCIMGFANCSPDAFAHTKKWEQAVLSVSFRCPQEVINVANLAVPEIRAFREGGSASYTEALPESLESGSLILGTKYAHILPHYFERAFNGDSVALRGSEVLVQVSDAIGKQVKTIPDYYKAVASVTQNLVDQLERLPYTLGTTDKRNNLNAKIQALECASAHFSSVEALADFVKRTERMNKKHADYTFSTVHRAKGSESNDVYLLNSLELQEQAKEDEYARRLFYVGVTRAKENITLVA